MAKNKTDILKKGYSNLPSGVKTALGIGLTIGVAYIAYRIFKKFSSDSIRQREQSKEVKKELDNSIRLKPLTFPKSQYSGFADTIQTAGFDVGTDEAAIYSVFNKLKNDSDYLALIDAWGDPTRTIYDWGMSYKMTLPQFLRWEMSDSEIKKINGILSNKKIKYRV
jgi:hypothetical protein